VRWYAVTDFYTYSFLNAKVEMHESRAVMMGENLFCMEVECLKVEYHLYRSALTLEMKQGVPGITY
jgi:hypothetical protein